MGTDDLFKKRRAARKKREHEFKTPKTNSFLIVTEGECTERLYFEGMQKLILEKVGGKIDVKPVIDIHGKGRATEKLIEATDKIVKNAAIFYQNIWVVFDKDENDDFDKAIEDGKSKGYNIAWSNQSFEYWLYLHFNYSDAALHRKLWEDKLKKIFVDNHLGNGTYEKNYEDIYNTVNIYDGVNTAINNAKRRMSGFDERRTKPSEYDPGTEVYKLVEQLKAYLE